MATARTGMVLNRPVFTQQRFSSASLTVLTTLIHRFTEPGTYQVTVTGGGATRSDSVDVSADGPHQQVNIDMSKPGDGRGSSRTGEAGGGCCCEPAAGRDLAVGGVAAFYASAGTGAYRVSVTHTGEREKRVVLDSSKTVPRGDFFALTLVRPGTYTITDELSSATSTVRVLVPERGRTDTEVVALLKLADGRFEPSTAELLAGQSVVVELDAEGRIACELDDPDETPDPIRSGRHTYRRSRRDTEA